MFDFRLLDVPKLFADGVGRSLVPGFAIVRLLSGENFDKTSSKSVESISLPHVPMEAHRVELRQNVNLVQTGIQAIGNGDIDQPIISSQRDSRLRTMLGQRKQTSSPATAEYKTDNIVRHG